METKSYVRLWKSLLAWKGISQAKMAGKIGITESTLIRKIKNPDTFTLNELKKISGVIGLDETITLFFLDKGCETERDEAK